MRQKVNEAAGASKSQGDGQAASKSLDRARDLVRGQESLSERMRQRRLGQGGNQQDGFHAHHHIICAFMTERPNYLLSVLDQSPIRTGATRSQPWLNS